MRVRCAWCYGAGAIVSAMVLSACVSVASAGNNVGTGRTFYARWKFGPPSDPNWFPIAVWLQDPKNANKYKAAGINLYIGLWKGPTEKQLAELKKASMPVICEQNEVGLAHKNDPIIVGWMHVDEPDNAQLVGRDAKGRPKYGPCIAPSEILRRYRKMKAADPDRPVYLGLGQGVANDKWRGRGSGASPDDYFYYVKGGDILSYDVYPVAGLNNPDLLWYVAKGVLRLRMWVDWNKSVGGPRIVWNDIETTNISNLHRKPSPHDVRAEVWMSLIHGSRGIVYFVHRFKPTFCEWALLDDPEMLAAVTAINKQILSLAPVLNSPTVDGLVTVRSSNLDTPIAYMAKSYGGAVYIFAVAMGTKPTRGTFTVSRSGYAQGQVAVLGEGRKLHLKKGNFADDFGGYDVHIYRVTSH